MVAPDPGHRELNDSSEFPSTSAHGATWAKGGWVRVGRVHIEGNPDGKLLLD
jgi:hypothetical protein